MPRSHVFARHRYFIEQRYELYQDEHHEAWRRLFARLSPRWDRYANSHYLEGIEALHLDPNRIPKLADVNEFLRQRTGFEAKAVSGYIPPVVFFDCLRHRVFPTTISIRPPDKLDYLPEPDIFHDVVGHVPMHTDPAFANTLVRFGECAHRAVGTVMDLRDKAERERRVASIIQAMARFFWFTIEFGLMNSRAGLRVYGSGLLSSFGEIEHAIDSPDVAREPIELERVINQGFEIDHYQPLLFIVDSFDHLFSLVEKLEKWMLEGRLDHIAADRPAA